MSFRSYVWFQKKSSIAYKLKLYNFQFKNILKQRYPFNILCPSHESDEETTKITKCRISANSFRGNYSFLELFGQRSQYISIKFPLHKPPENRGNYSREEIIQGRKLFAEIRYIISAISGVPNHRNYTAFYIKPLRQKVGTFLLVRIVETSKIIDIS